LSVQTGAFTLAAVQEELRKLNSSVNIIKVTKSMLAIWAGHVALMGETRNLYEVLAGEHEERRPLGKSGRRSQDNIRADLK
jgi:hypothetical protein